MEWLHNTVLGRVVLLAVFVLSLQIPIHWIHGLVGEREERIVRRSFSSEAVTERETSGPCGPMMGSNSR